MKPRPSRRQANRWSENRRQIERYCDEVLSGKIITGRLERAAVIRWRDDCVNAESRGLYFDAETAERAVALIECLKHSTGEFAGHPFKLQPWQKFVVFNLFGWKQDSNGFRRFREAFISMGRGNGKSPFMAAITNCLVLLDGEARSQFQIAAVERAQAEIVFNEMCEQLQSQPSLQGRFQFFRAKHGKKCIVDTLYGSVIEPLGSEGRDGFNLLGYVADEIHAWGEEHQPLWEKLNTSMSKRRQPLGLVITTAGDDRSKLWLRVHEWSAKIVERIVEEDRHFSFVCEIDEDDRNTSLYDETLWRKGNPNLDISVKREGLRLYANKAKNDPVVFNEWLRYYMNLRVRSVLKVIKPELWNSCGGDLPDLRGRACHGGLDLGWRNDIASFYLCFPLGENRFAFKGWNWLPEHGGRDLTSQPWRQWIEEGHLTATDGEVTDPEAIYARVAECMRQYNIRSIALDPNNARVPATHFINNMKLEVFDFQQNGKNYNEPCREFLSALTEQRVLHGRDPVLGFAANNLVLRTDYAGLRMPDKRKADEKIDPMVASLMAYARCLYGEPAPAVCRVRVL